MDQNNIRFSIPIGGYVYYITFLNNLGYTKSWSTCRHNHSEIEVQFILSGECRILLGDTFAEVKAGNVLMIAPLVYHAPISSGPSVDFEKYSFIFSFAEADKNGKDFIAREAKKFAAAFNSIEKFRIFEDCFGGANAWREVVKEFREMQSGYFTRIISIITGILVSLSRCLAEGDHIVEPLPRKTLDENRTIIMESFFDYDQNFVRTQKELLADTLGVSSRQLGRIIKRTYDRSFREKLLQSRMEVAADLLANTDRSIASIANQLGYTTEAGFYRLFNNYFKSTPASFRKKIRLK